MRITVLLNAWEIDCCLAVPSVGDRVAWPLLWVDERDLPGLAPFRWTSELFVQLDPEEQLLAGVAAGYLLTHGPVSAWWTGLEGSAAPSHGVLMAGLHGDVPTRIPTTRGRTRDVSSVTRTSPSPVGGEARQAGVLVVVDVTP